MDHPVTSEHAIVERALWNLTGLTGQVEKPSKASANQ